MCFGKGSMSLNQSQASQLTRCNDKETAVSNAKQYKKDNPKALKKFGCKLLLYLICYLMLVGLVAFAVSYIVWYCSLIICLLGLFLLCYLPIQSCLAFGTSCPYDEETIREDPLYQDKALIQQCWDKVLCTLSAALYIAEKVTERE